MYLSLSIINEGLELDRILENANLDEYTFINLPMEQQDELLHKPTGFGLAPTFEFNTGSKSVVLVSWCL